MPENTAAEQGGMRPTVSVIIPIFNVEKYLAQCLDSIRAQDEPLQVLCVNDGSTDGSKEIIERYVELDSRFVLVDKPNGGYGNAVNVGLDHATGDYISIIEPDDWIEPGMYTEMIDYLAPLYGVYVGYGPRFTDDDNENGFSVRCLED